MSGPSEEESATGGMTAKQCSARAIVEETADDIAFAMWHPQWGGYRSMCRVSFDKTTSDASGKEIGCFEVANHHDGDFPSEAPTTYHYCDAAQLIEFGIDIIEKQLAHQRNDKGQRVSVPATLGKMTARLLALLPDGLGCASARTQARRKLARAKWHAHSHGKKS